MNKLWFESANAEESVVINKRPEARDLYWDNWYWSAKKFVEIKRPTRKWFLTVNTQKRCSRCGLGPILCWQLNLVLFRVPEVILVLKAWRGHRVTEVWHCEGPGEATGEGIASVALGALKGLKGSRREVKAWHQEKNKGQAIGESTTLLQLERPSILEMPVPRDDYLEQQQQWSTQLEPEKWPKHFGGVQKIISGSQILDTEL